jgi:hypothetical protein
MLFDGESSLSHLLPRGEEEDDHRKDWPTSPALTTASSSATTTGPRSRSKSASSVFSRCDSMESNPSIITRKYRNWSHETIMEDYIAPTTTDVDVVSGKTTNNAVGVKSSLMESRNMAPMTNVSCQVSEQDLQAVRISSSSSSTGFTEGKSQKSVESTSFCGISLNSIVSHAPKADRNRTVTRNKNHHKTFGCIIC